MKDRYSQPLFIAAIGLSAFALFTLELLAGRLVLPLFGGTPSVWTTALCFFTAVVFVGYAYAHWLGTRFGQRVGGAVHAVLAAVVAAVMLAAPRDLGGLRVPGIDPALNVLVLLAIVAGAPALLFATTTPLLSAWFSGRGRDPWWLYAVSNGASLAGLLAYPFVIEPLVPLSTQRAAIGWVLPVFVLLLAGVAATAPRGAPAGVAAPATPRPSLRMIAAWVFAAAVPAGLLSATTTAIATDQVSTPLLWVGPLAIYLGSFVIAFSARGRRVLPVAERLVPAAVTVMWVPFIVRVSWPVPVLLAVLLGAFAVVAVAVHGRLALSRPDGAHLTGFYLAVSGGGLLATAFVALLAPLVFSGVYEYPVLLVGALAALAMLPGPEWPAVSGPGGALRAAGARMLPFAIVSAALLATAPHASLPFVGVVLVIGSLVIIICSGPRGMAFGSAIAVVTLTLVFSPPYLLRVRTFFGITEIRSAENGDAVSEVHGTTLHGLQFTDERRTEPTAYFVRSGPLGDVFAELATRRPDGASIGVVGLGVGTIAAYERPTDAMTYFEVDHAVITLAQDRRYFTYLSDAPSAPRIVLGDGRLSLAAMPAGSFDLLVLDAFSSDAVPAHLLTREAMRAYLRTLEPGGVLVFQLTNRHFDLTPAVAETARSVGLEARTLAYTPDAAARERLAAQASRWLVAGTPEAMGRFEAAGWETPVRGPVLTDDYTSILQLMKRP
ncbi:MAG: hypothetical protein D9V44_07650 [Actinobacteria bacterium]|nr:MAG: hypothetical protein D9V44_07650 [Actinomycetota bacterium]